MFSLYNYAIHSSRKLEPREEIKDDIERSSENLRNSVSELLRFTDISQQEPLDLRVQPVDLRLGISGFIRVKSFAMMPPHFID